MDLHELMGAAVADLPELPDQLADVDRIHHRRTATKRATLVSVSTALVLGVGTLTIASPWAHQATNGVSAADSSSPAARARFAENEARILQSAWPVKGAKITWVRQNDDAEDISQYDLFRVQQGTTIWQLHLTLFGSSPTTPYPLVTTLPSECVMEPANCVSDDDGDIHVYVPGPEIPAAYVSSGNEELYRFSIDEMPSASGSPVIVLPHASVWTPPRPTPLTIPQIKQFALSDGMREVYTEAAEAGLLNGGSVATATASHTP